MTKIPTYTNEIRKSIIDNYLSFNLVAFLIYKPSLGITDAPTNAELNLRKELTMEEAAASEIGGINLNGYSRIIVDLASSVNNNIDNLSTNTKDIYFIPTTGIIGPFTHVVVARGANITGGTIANGNNRGNITGTIIYTEPVVNAPLIIEPPQQFKFTVNLNLATKPST